jgi:hypothetical protein
VASWHPASSTSAWRTAATKTSPGMTEQGAVQRSLLCGIVASGVVDECVAYGGSGDLAWRGQRFSSETRAGGATVPFLRRRYGEGRPRGRKFFYFRAILFSERFFSKRRD